jgi:hypothetical protein
MIEYMIYTIIFDKLAESENRLYQGLTEKFWSTLRYENLH